MKKLLFLSLILAACVRLSAQQEHHYTQFMYNKLMYNPAYSGTRGVPSVTGIYRNQWIGFDGAPASALMSFNSPFLTPRVGVGVVFSGLKIGLQRDFYGSLAYSYELLKTETVSIRAGIQGSIRSVSFAFNEANPINIGDPSLDNQRVNSVRGNVGAGVYGTFMGKYYVGFSIPRIYKNTLGFSNDQANLVAKESPHFYAVTGGIVPLSEDINLMPAVLVKYVEHAPIDADVNVNIDIRQIVTAGLSYRVGGNGAGESVSLLAMWQATPQIGVGAAYDFSLSSIKDYNAGSMEILLQADLKKPKNGGGRKKKDVFHPRFFM
ncbi:MAG: type IX secretion system membrane protein PorP/SprF [Saprospiraceae bacterium]|nr:type IX secretion system membrane protein PorP/SprF [Saprospiraceae bacterium]